MTNETDRAAAAPPGMGPLLAATSLLFASCGDGAAGPACTADEWRCTADATVLEQCVAGRWQATHCMRDQQQLCEQGACVDPWRLGSPSWSHCPDEPRATAESLSEKAAGYEELAGRLYLHPDLGWMLGVWLPCAEVACTGGEPPPCHDCTIPSPAEAVATWQDVESWKSGENDGLWSSLYLTAEAYRFGATHSPEARARLLLLLEGERRRMAITGVAGLYTRQLIPPGIGGLACPTDPTAYLPSEDKKSNRWVRVGEDGCQQVADPDSLQLVSTSHCGLGEYAGWCWLDNVSQDEYSGHMLAHAAVARLVDDPEVRALNAELGRQIGLHLRDHQLELTDWDGRSTEHGRLWPTELLSGFQAAMSLAFVKASAEASGDAEVQAFLDQCLLKRTPPAGACIERFGAAESPYDELVMPASLYLDCLSNWNNFSMHMLSLHTLLLLERDPATRARYQAALDGDMFRPTGVSRPLSEQHNPFFDLAFAADKALGPSSDGPAFAAVEDAVCMLRQFPASEHHRAVDCPDDQCVEVCKDRMGNPMTDYARPAAERCMDTFIWWGTPYGTNDCSEDARQIEPPADYLLPYWMGRYYGFIDADR